MSLKNSILMKRESRRAYLDKAIPADVLDRIKEKVRWSPSCSNNQPWRFVFVQDKKRHEKLVSALAKGNSWAAAAPVIVVVCAREADDYSRDDNPVKYYQFDCGLASMALMVAATEEGLMAHGMAGWSADGVSEALEIPAEYDVMCVTTLGYQGSPDQLEEPNRSRETSPRERKPLNEVICDDVFKFSGD